MKHKEGSDGLTVKSDSVIVRDMREDDIDSVLEIERTLKGRQWTRMSFRETLKRAEAHFYVSVPEGHSEGGRVLGYCGCYCALDEAEIVNVAVREQNRGSGIGRRMIDHLLDDRMKHGSRIFILEVRSLNEPALRLYKSEGFVSCGVRRHFYQMPDEDAVIMRLETEER